MPGRSDRKKTLETIAVLAAAALLFYLIFRSVFFLAAALALPVIGLFFKGTAARLAAGWRQFSLALGNLNTRLLLGLVYYLLLTPLALLFRALHRDPLETARDPVARTYFRERERLFVPEDLEKPW